MFFFANSMSCDHNKVLCCRAMRVLMKDISTIKNNSTSMKDLTFTVSFSNSVAKYNELLLQNGEGQWVSYNMGNFSSDFNPNGIVKADMLTHAYGGRITMGLLNNDSADKLFTVGMSISIEYHSSDVNDAVWELIDDISKNHEIKYLEFEINGIKRKCYPKYIEPSELTFNFTTCPGRLTSSSNTIILYGSGTTKRVSGDDDSFRKGVWVYQSSYDLNKFPNATVSLFGNESVTFRLVYE